MPSSVMLRRVALVRTDISEERSASVIRVARIGELGRMLAVTDCLAYSYGLNTHYYRIADYITLPCTLL
jgi:hypothetical protein